MKPTSSRRDFLTGRAAADAMAGAAAGSGAGALPDQDRQSPSNPPAGPSYLVQVARRAMACEFEVRFNAGQYEHDTEAALEVLDLVETLEDQMSVFRQASEICHINRTAARQPVEVEPGLFELLELAVRLHGETQRAFDPIQPPRCPA
jgi:thiamine biosynthesis lipoprotein